MYWLVIILAVILVIWLCKSSSSGERIICTDGHCVEGFSEAPQCPPGQEMICSVSEGACWCAYPCKMKYGTGPKCPPGFKSVGPYGSEACVKCPVKGKFRRA